KRNQTSQRLLAKTLNHNPSNVGIQLLGPNPRHGTLPRRLTGTGAGAEGDQNFFESSTNHCRGVPGWPLTLGKPMSW
ncbi:hypothetical protein FHS91_003855, partial [Sphingobium xanthum]